MDRDKIISKVVDFMKKEDCYIFEIENFLRDNRIPEGEFNGIIDEARSKLVQFAPKVDDKEIESISLKHTIFFGCSIIIVIATFVYLYFFLPYEIELSSNFYPILAAILICFFSFTTIIYYKTWKFDYIGRLGSPKINFGLIAVLSLIPGVILFFVFQSKFENVAEELLIKNQTEVVGTIVSGREKEMSRRGGSIKMAKVFVEFYTLEGEKIIAEESVSHYEFESFYLDQKVNLIYSKTNPRNIAILNNEYNIKKFKKSEERDLLPKDLIFLMKVEDKNILKELNKISYGWLHDSSKNIWVNNRKNIAIHTPDNNSISYLSNNLELPNYYLEKEGFVKIDKAHSNIQALFPNEIIYTKINLVATIKSLRTEISNSNQLIYPPTVVITILETNLFDKNKN